MKTRETTPGKTYSVHTSSGCTVSDKNGWSKTIDAPDGYFTAHAGEVTIDGDDAADVRELFKLAPQQRLAILGVLGGDTGLPAGYKPVEYLESVSNFNLNGVNNGPAILFGRRVSKLSVFDMKTSLQLEETSKNLAHFIFGCANYKKSALVFATFRSRLDKSDDVAITNGEGAKLIVDISPLQKYSIKIDLSRAEAIIDNSIYQLSYNAAKIEEAAEIPYSIFACNCYGGVGYAAFENSGNIRIYSFSESQDGKYVLNALPALDETGAPCMFDTVTRTPFYNANTGDFIYPTASTTYGLRRVLPDWGKLTEHGLRRLYHAPANYKGELIDYAIENGFKPIVEPERPEDGYWTPRWTETEDEIVLEWVETEPPTDEFGLTEEPLT